MFEYADYLREADTITIEECEKLFSDFQESAAKIPEEDQDLVQATLRSVMEYANIRSQWFSVFTRDERIEKDERRTGKHDAVLRNLDILARYEDRLGLDTTWRKELGDKSRRKRIGDFACYIAFMYGINGR